MHSLRSVSFRWGALFLVLSPLALDAQGSSALRPVGNDAPNARTSAPPPVAAPAPVPGARTLVPGARTLVPGARTLTVEQRGDILMARKMYREAIDMYRQGPDDSPQLTNKIGIAFHQLLQLDAAKRYYERAIKLDPQYAEAINNLGTIYYARKSYRRAVGYYKRAIRLAPAAAAMQVNLGSAYFARRNYDKAAECYEAALKLDPDVFERRSQYGSLLQERSVDDRAKFHLYLAKTYAKAGENKRALIYLRKALEEGIKGKERDKIIEMPEFAALKTDAEFKDLLASTPRTL